MNPDNDIALIQKFVQGELSLLANQNLRVEPAFDTAQLLSKKGGLLATAKLVGQIRSVLVRQSSTYQELINRILVEHRYIPISVNEKGFVEYERRPIPPGYELNSTEVRQLWKIWRIYYSKKKDQAPLLVLTSQGWEAVRTIAFSQENFFVQLETDELMLQVSDRIVWLSPVEEEEATQIFTPIAPVDRNLQAERKANAADVPSDQAPMSETPQFEGFNDFYRV
ncbi:MAG: hypothetical protein KME13_17645 [Myxacorys californica WJT36-NPBG1]|jgi:hypothetical protein|nr:hypothetical protein [Myxacorys californica WJT36-NPBG1]